MQSVKISLHDEFKRQFKRLRKKYVSLTDDLQLLRRSLEQDPLQGVSLGMGGTHKVRMAIMSKGGGKSGGARVITYVVTLSAQNDYSVTLLTIYDKSEMENVRDEYIKSLLSNIG